MIVAKADGSERVCFSWPSPAFLNYFMLRGNTEPGKKLDCYPRVKGQSSARDYNLDQHVSVLTPPSSRPTRPPTTATGSLGHHDSTESLPYDHTYSPRRPAAGRLHFHLQSDEQLISNKHLEVLTKTPSLCEISSPYDV
ncbi:hypothetical protein NDA14_004543 [Ustilago hordei]|nr:hypothetical protein NDA10_003066 [Ustilago hordei]KAJ1585737.1 hypothetical protein NDA12_001289 [Ustilago hordei]KAJ1588956.1 hypothetical protein NDA15_000872 [Ustilago hordei]KAJ1600872.1 hypothetical protein NDA14_004543 [Ustilago hordei]